MRRPIRSHLEVALGGVVAAAALAACRPAPELPVRVAAASSAAAARAEAEADAEAERQMAQLRRFAMNALVVPLLDDAEPPRWADPTVGLDCAEGAAVTVDGRALPVGSPLPPHAFTLRWRLDGCRPWASALPALTGEVELDVFHDDDGLSAVVRPVTLRVATPAGTRRMEGAFGAPLGLSPHVPS